MLFRLEYSMIDGSPERIHIRTELYPWFHFALWVHAFTQVYYCWLLTSQRLYYKLCFPSTSIYPSLLDYKR